MYCGVDIGARSVEVVLFDGAQVVEYGIDDSGSSPTATAERLFEGVLSSAGIKPDQLRRIISTGYGRNYFNRADRALSEILCHASGCYYLFPSARTVIDIGGQDSKLIRLDENGRAVDFAMNDRCAAGTGRFIEMAGETVGLPLETMGEVAESDAEPVEISSMCAVFAESEIIGLLQGNARPESILKGIFRSVASRTLGMAGASTLEPDLVFTGGVARNPGVVQALESQTGLKAMIPYEPRITGALGAAIAASEMEGK